MSAGTSMYPTQCRFESLERVKPIQLTSTKCTVHTSGRVWTIDREAKAGSQGAIAGWNIQPPYRHRDAAAEQPPSRASKKDICIIKLLQNGDNGGLCPFVWQDFTVFIRGNMAGSCQ